MFSCLCSFHNLVSSTNKESQVLQFTKDRCSVAPVALPSLYPLLGRFSNTDMRGDQCFTCVSLRGWSVRTPGYENTQLNIQHSARGSGGRTPSPNNSQNKTMSPSSVDNIFKEYLHLMLIGFFFNSGFVQWDSSEMLIIILIYDFFKE